MDISHAATVLTKSIHRLEPRDRSFAESLLSQHIRRGLSDKQKPYFIRLAEKLEKPTEPETPKGTAVGDMSRIMTLFDTAQRSGIEKPKFRTAELVISLAPAHGRNAGALYVTDTESDTYLGKIVNGAFQPTRDASPEHAQVLSNIVADPLAVGIAYGKQTGRCCCCGRKLTDPISVERGIGPICESNWGL